MNLLDGVILAVAVAAAVGGWRLGFVARLLAWGGVAVGLALGVQFVPRVVTAFGGANADNRVTVALLWLVLAAMVGQAIGIGLGAILNQVVPAEGGIPRWDRAAGAGIGVVGVLALVWMTTPSLAIAKGWPASYARDSLIVGVIDDLGPEQPATFAAWGRSIADAPYPAALGPLDDPPDPGVPPDEGLSPELDASVRTSTVKVSGHACDRIQEGSGWVVQHGLVVTNAHVVAGERSTLVESEDGGSFDATVVAFDPARDLAVLLVPDLDAPPLPRGDGDVGDTGAVYGHPGGEGLRAAPARVGDEIVAVGTDIYRTADSKRNVFVLAASLAPGDSGGALVNAEGTVIGVAFAIDPGRDAIAYAVTDDELRPVLDGVSGTPVDTGPCLVD